MNRWNRSLFWNPVSIVALLLVVLGLVGSLVLAIGELASAEAEVYRSLFAWVIFPAIGWLGLLLCLGGVLRKRYQLSQASPEKYPKYFRIDFSQPRTRHMLLFSAVGLFVLLIWGTFTSYHAYEFTESTAFCASACHSVMQPERVTHQISPHAAVSCSACHVGKTPTQYLEAKIYGLNELYRVATNSYERPIPTPIHALEPVRENCTGCHWEQQYWGTKHRDFSHYITAEDNQHWTLKMNVKVGGMHRLGDEGEGIHWHMKLNSKVFFIATDEQLQNIPWVKLVTEDGEELIYSSTDNPIAEEELSQYEAREMSCIDCHNRPAHQFKAPIQAIDDAMTRELIDPSLPEIKVKGIELLVSDAYTSGDEAVNSIRSQVITFYREEHPLIFQSRRAAIEQAAEALAAIYRQNFFPEMKADWRAYPDNIGHFLSDGCFRCHDGSHQTPEGKAISNDCSLCHDIVVQGPTDDLEADPQGLPFRHPIDFGLPVIEIGKCTDCHNGMLGN